jgi:hypothetical protein
VREEGARLKGTLMRTNELYRVAALPTVLALLAMVAVAVTVGLFLASTGYLRTALRRKSPPKASSDWDTIPGCRMDLNSSARAEQQPVLDLQLTLGTSCKALG